MNCYSVLNHPVSKFPDRQYSEEMLYKAQGIASDQSIRSEIVFAESNRPVYSEESLGL